MALDRLAGIPGKEMRRFVYDVLTAKFTEYRFPHTEGAIKFAADKLYDSLPADQQCLFRAAVGGMSYKKYSAHCQNCIEATRQKNVASFLWAHREKLINYVEKYVDRADGKQI